MLIKILLVIAILIQTVATAYALKLVRATKYNSVWILFIVGFSLLSVERFVQLLMASGQYVPRWWFAYLGIVISICLSIGVMYAHKLFKYIGRLNRQRQLLNKRILTAVLRTEEKARSRFSKELHDGLGPLLSSARMSLSALARDERSPEQKEIIDNTTYVIDEAIRSLREISNNLSPHVLNDFGLARGVQNFIDKSAAMHDVKIRFTTNLRSERFDTDVEVNPLPGDLRADQQLAQACRLFVDQPFAVAERDGTGAGLYGRRAGVQPAGHDGLRHGAFEHLVAHQFAGRRVRHCQCQRPGDARRDPCQYAGGAGIAEAPPPQTQMIWNARSYL